MPLVFIHSLVDGYFSDVNILPILNNALVNVHEQIKRGHTKMIKKCTGGVQRKRLRQISDMAVYSTNTTAEARIEE